MLANATRVLLAVALAALITGCGVLRFGEGPRPINSNVISIDEMTAARAVDCYGLIEVLRPQWLRKRGILSMHDDVDIVVYLDNGRLGGPNAMRGIQLDVVHFVRFYDPAAATYRYGEGHPHGAILISTQPKGLAER